VPKGYGSRTPLESIVPPSRPFVREKKLYEYSMKTRTALSVLLGSLLTGPLTTAQAEVNQAQAPHGQAKSVAADRMELGTPLDFGVHELTVVNADSVTQSLNAMDSKACRCDGAKRDQTRAGRCSTDDPDRKTMRHALVFEVRLFIETQMIRLTPFAGHTLRYTELEGTLMKSSVQIDSSRFPVAGKARLVLSGCTPKNAAIIEKALLDTKLFDFAKADYGASSGEVHVLVHASTVPPMLEKVISTIDALGITVTVSDVIWGPLTPPTKA